MAIGEISAGGTIIGGMIGQRGTPGNGITSIEKTGESGLVETYTITYTNGDTFDFEITNGAKGDTGNGISNIEKTGTTGLVDTYTITYTNGTTDTFSVTNGENGEPGTTDYNNLQNKPDLSVYSLITETGNKISLALSSNKLTASLSDKNNNVISTSSEITLPNPDLSACEKLENKVTSISSSSTDTQYPTAKCVYDIVGDIESLLETLDVGDGV
jgi:hypothetical protein